MIQREVRDVSGLSCEEFELGEGESVTTPALVCRWCRV